MRDAYITVTACVRSNTPYLPTLFLQPAPSSEASPTGVNISVVVEDASVQAPLPQEIFQAQIAGALADLTARLAAIETRLTALEDTVAMTPAEREERRQREIEAEMRRYERHAAGGRARCATAMRDAHGWLISYAEEAEIAARRREAFAAGGRARAANALRINGKFAAKSAATETANEGGGQQ